MSQKISAFLLNDLNIPKLSEEQQKQCEGSISSEECFCLLNSFDLTKPEGMMVFPLNSTKPFGQLSRIVLSNVSTNVLKKVRYLTLKNKLSLL